MSSCRFPERRRLEVASGFTSIDSTLRLKAKEIVGNFISTQEEGEEDLEIRGTTTCTSIINTEGNWQERSRHIAANLSKQISSLKRQIVVNREHLLRKKNSLLKFVKLAQTNSLLAADLLHEGKGGVPTGRGQWLKRHKVRCCKVSDGQQCTDTALLYSKYCLGHITSDKRQVLYQACVAIDGDTLSRCNRPVLELLQDKGPYCLKHVPSIKLETKKTVVKLPSTSAKVQGLSLKRKSPGTQKIKAAQDIKKTLSIGLPSPIQPLPPLSQSLSPLLPPPLSSTWSLADNEGERNRTGFEQNLSPTKDVNPLLPTSQSAEQMNLSPFSLDSAQLPPPLPALSMPPILLLPPDPTPGSFLDDDSSSNDGN